MIPLMDLHVHTTFCDGADPVDALCRTAIEKGFTTLGISGHGFTPFDTSYCMQRDAISSYVDAVNAAKEKYAPLGLRVLLGVEKDVYGEGLAGVDYTIHSVHYVKQGDKYFPVDESPAHLEEAIRAFGDPYALCEAYFDAVSEAARGEGQILGHLDLIAKFNAGSRYFDETHPRYLAAAGKAVRAAKEAGKTVEINLGAYRKGLRSVPYPSPHIMQFLSILDVPVMLNGDTHKAADLGALWQEGTDYIASFKVKTKLILE